MARTKNNRSGSAYKMKGFPAHAVKSPLNLPFGPFNPIKKYLKNTPDGQKIEQGKKDLYNKFKETKVGKIVEKVEDKAYDLANKAEPYIETASYIPVIDRVASGIDASKDAWDYSKAKKEGDEERAKSEMLDVAANLVGVAGGGGAKHLTKLATKGGQKILKKKAQKETADLLADQADKHSQSKLKDVVKSKTIESNEDEDNTLANVAKNTSGSSGSRLANIAKNV